MPDLLVALYSLPDSRPALERVREQGVVVRTAMACEKLRVVGWVRAVFGDGWAGECDVAFARQPVSCFVAIDGGRLAGFACYESTCRNFFGPMGVAATARGRGIGSALLLECLAAMRAQGYAYAIIGGAGDGGIYRNVAGATEIAGSSPGIYRDRLSAGADFGAGK